MTRLTRYALYLSSTVAALGLSPAVYAADLLIAEPMANQPIDLSLPAVSGVNGKLEFDVGGNSDPSGASFRGAGSLSLPLGDHFGLQGDVGVESIGGDLIGGGALHLFMRDPSSYLIGVTAGVVAADGASLAAVGPEGELYLDRVSLEGWAGYASLQYDDVLLDDDSGLFAIGDVAFYPTDNWRLSVGGETILGHNALKLATEYQFDNLPFSGVGELRFGADGDNSIRIGLKGYFGDPGKSLINRHRQDDPPNRVLDLFGAASQLTETPDEPDPEDFDNESACQAAGFYWDYEASVCLDPPA